MQHCKWTKQNIWTAILLLLIVITLCVIWGHSLEGPQDSSKKSQAVLENLVKPILGPLFGAENITEYFVRKLGHFAEFFALGLECFLLLWVRRKIELHWMAHCFCFGFLVGAMDETLQLFTGRGSSLADVWLDFAGFAVAAGLVLLGAWIKKVKFYREVH
jgi:hypothetical protein